MAGRVDRLIPNEGDNQAAKSNMMDMWRQSIDRSREKSETVTETQDSQKARQEYERKIRSGEIPCPTCEARTYQDGSDDPGVSFKTPGHIDPASSAAVVMSHEMEHVMNENAEAERDGGRVTAQSVVLHRAICPTCGRSYVSGGVTSTTKTATEKRDPFTAMDMSV